MSEIAKKFDQKDRIDITLKYFYVYFEVKYS